MILHYNHKKMTKSLILEIRYHKIHSTQLEPVYIHQLGHPTFFLDPLFPKSTGFIARKGIPETQK